MKSIDCSVLIVDDDEVDRYLIRRLLGEANVRGEVFEAHHGAHALEFLGTDFDEKRAASPASFPPRTILLDINMPVMNGFEFLDALSELQSSNELYQTIVFAMITSSTNPVDQTRAGDYECVRQYFGKDELSAARLHEMFNSEFGTN